MSPGGAFRKLGRLYELPPKEVVRRLRHRMHKGGAGYDLDAAMAPGSKHVNAQRPYDTLNRYEAILRGAEPIRQPLDLENRRVLEIGPGPTLGLAPLAVFRGARDVHCVEPMFDPAVWDHPAFTGTYLPAVHRDLTAIFGPLMDRDAFIDRLRDRTQVHATSLEEAPLAGAFDVHFSNSCLEHIIPIEPGVRRLAELSRPGTRFIHLVDFGNHESKEQPFQGMYDVPVEEARRRLGHHINLVRAQEMAAIFEDAGLPCVVAPYNHGEELAPASIHSEWTRAHSREDLLVRVALLADRTN